MDLQTTAGYFAPSDQAWRQCFDIDLGSSGPILIPDSTFSSHSYAVMADKENFLWTIDRQNLGGYTGTPACSTCDYANKKCVVQGVRCNRCTNSNPNLPEPPMAFGPFPDIDNGPFDRSAAAFWSGSANTGDKGELYLGGLEDQLKRFPVSTACPSGQVPPICNFVVQTNVQPAPPAAAGLGYSATPSISSNYQNGQYTNGIMWAIKTQASPAGGADAILYAFNAIDLTELYDTTQCTQSGTLVDQPGPGEKFTVPTIANGYVFIGTQTDFDIYGPLQRSCGN
jgi:hypothetical protein